MRLRTLSLAAVVLLLTAGAASASVITRALHLRAGPTTRSAIVATMPAGAYVSVLGRRGGWCYVNWHGRRGYAVCRYIARGRGYIYRRYYYPDYYPDYYYYPGVVVWPGYWGGYGGYYYRGGHRHYRGRIHHFRGGVRHFRSRGGFHGGHRGGFRGGHGGGFRGGHHGGRGRH